MKLNPLTEKISKHLSIHPSRQNTMAAMIFRFYAATTSTIKALCAMSIAPLLKLPCGRWNAFFCNEELSPEEYAKAVVEMLGFKGRFDFSLDRSNWKYGKK